MLALHDDPNSENSKTSHLLTALYAAVQIQKRKVVVGPYDSVGIMFYNTVRLLSPILLLFANDLTRVDAKERGWSWFRDKERDICLSTYLYYQRAQDSRPHPTH
jgi:hypothetical protein